MALFHLSVTQTKRSAGQSAIASAAYRAGERLYSEYYGEYSDYTRKGGVICSDILLPSHAPPEYADRQTLWNAVEKAERGYRCGKDDHTGQKGETDSEGRGKGIGVDRYRIDAVFVGESEASGLKSQYKNNLEYGDVCHKLRDHAVTCRSKESGVERDEQEIDDSCQNCAQTVYRGLSSQLF